MPVPDLESPLAQAIAVLLGSAAHILVFVRGEWHLSTVKLVLSYITVQAVAVSVLPTLSAPLGTNGSHLAAARIAGTLGALWAAGVFGSMLIYRGFLHCLGRFKGPFLARFSNFYVTTLAAKKLHLHKEIQTLHEKYGDIVRVGPMELSINNAEIFAAISAPNSPCTKGDWYDILHPMTALQNVRDKQAHSLRRCVWDRGFSAKALRDYEPRVTRYTSQLLAKISSSEGASLNVTDWFNFYSFDVMADLAWGKSLHMLRDGVRHYYMKSLHDDMVNVGLFTHLIWLTPLFKSMPLLNAAHLQQQKWVNAQVEERWKMKPEKPDVFAWLLEDYESKPRTAKERIDLAGDANLIAVAGSDTTAAILTCLFFHLATEPTALKTLQKEIDEADKAAAAAAATATSTLDGVALSKLPYLNAVINETIRLSPPVPSGLQRQTPPGGMTVGDIFIPGDTIVQVPSYTIFRDERYWGRPNDFVPERWTTKPELTKNSSVYAPFGFGRSSCVGKHLGLMEVRHVTSAIVRDYDVRLAPGQSGTAFIKSQRDTFTLALGELKLVFDRRSSSSSHQPTATMDRLDETAPLLSTPAAATAPLPPTLLVEEQPCQGQARDNTTHNDDEPANNGGSKPNMAVIFPAVASGIFLAAADGTIVLVNYATISSELNALNKAQWIVTIYTLAVACFQPLYGKLCDIFGRKACLLAAYVLFALGCLACGMSSTIEGLIAARVLQAVGGSGLGTIISILLTDLVSEEDRGVWQGLLNIVYLFGAGIGAPVGGFLAGSIGWRWSFIGQVPLSVLAIFVIVVCLPDDHHHHARSSTADNDGNDNQPATTLAAKLRRIDFLGSAALIVTIGAFLFALDRGGNVSWSAPEFYIPLLISAASGVLFASVELRVAPEPVMPPSVVFAPGLLPIYAYASMAFFAIIALEFTLPLYYQARGGASPQRAAVYLIPAMVTGTSAALVTGFWLRRKGQYYYALLFACACQTVGAVVVYLFSGGLGGESTALLVVGQVISELGVGNVVVSALIAVITIGSTANSALQISAYYSIRNMGSVLGVTAISTVIQQGLRDMLASELSGRGGVAVGDVDAIVDEVRRSLDTLKTLDPEIAEIVRRCYGAAIHRGFALVLVVVVLSAIPAVFVQGGREARRKNQVVEE